MKHGAADPRKRRFLLLATTALGAVGTGVAAVPFALSMRPSARALSLGGPVDVDISKLEDGQMLTVEWRGKPVWILRRTPAMLAQLERNAPLLADPDSRVASQQPKYATNLQRLRFDRPGVGRCLHASWLCAVGTTGRRPGIGTGRRLARRIFLSVPRLDVRSGGAGFQERPGTHKPCRAAKPLHQRQPRRGRRGGGDHRVGRTDIAIIGICENGVGEFVVCTRLVHKQGLFDFTGCAADSLCAARV